MDYLTQKLLAVLSRHTKIEDSKRDVYIYQTADKGAAFLGKQPLNA